MVLLVTASFRCIPICASTALSQITSDTQWYASIGIPSSSHASPVEFDIHVLESQIELFVVLVAVLSGGLSSRDWKLRQLE